MPKLSIACSHGRETSTSALFDICTRSPSPSVSSDASPSAEVPIFRLVMQDSPTPFLFCWFEQLGSTAPTCSCSPDSTPQQQQHPSSSRSHAAAAAAGCRISGLTTPAMRSTGIRCHGFRLRYVSRVRTTGRRLGTANHRRTARSHHSSRLSCARVPHRPRPVSLTATTEPFEAVPYTSQVDGTAPGVKRPMFVDRLSVAGRSVRALLYGGARGRSPPCGISSGLANPESNPLTQGSDRAG